MATRKRSKGKYRKGSLFSPHQDGGQSAYLQPNRGVYARLLYARGYFATAEYVGRHLLETGIAVDTAIYPFVFLYRHGLELVLKQLADDMRALKPRYPVPGKALGGHALGALWSAVHPFLRDYGHILPGEDDPPSLSFDEITDIIGDLEQVDWDGQAGRYDKRKDRSETLNQFGSLDIKSLSEPLEYLAQSLMFWAHQFHEQRQQHDFETWRRQNRSARRSHEPT